MVTATPLCPMIGPHLAYLSPIMKATLKAIVASDGWIHRSPALHPTTGHRSLWSLSPDGPPLRVSTPMQSGEVLITSGTIKALLLREMIETPAQVDGPPFQITPSGKTAALDTKPAKAPLQPEAFTPDAPIAALNLSTRASNCLRRANIHTVSELIAVPATRLAKIRNLGSNTLAELRSRLAEINHELP